MNNENIKVIDNITYKKCNRCNQWIELNINNFYMNTDKKSNKKYYHPYCKQCEKIKNSKYRKEHPENTALYAAKRYKKPKLRLYLDNLSKKRREEGKYREWQQKNREKINSYNSVYSNKRHKIKNKEWINCKNYFRDENNNWCCAYCGITEQEHKERYRQQLHKEHVNHNGEGDLSNCVPSCRHCNTSKHTEDMELWFRKQDFFNEESYNKIIKWVTEDYKVSLED